jgi:predicted DNA-binding transcriptional regulator AlpA
MTKPKHIPPEITSAAGYVESDVSSWIHARIRGQLWEPGSLPEHPRIIRKRGAQARTGLSNFTLWTLEKRGQFPPRVRLTPPGPRNGDGGAQAAAAEGTAADRPTTRLVRQDD